MEHMIHKKFPPSTDLWLCKHEVSYPDICEECKKDEIDGTDNRRTTD